MLGNSYVVESGLTDGEEIVTDGTFSVDAAAQLAGKPSMMNRNEPHAKKISKTNKKNSMPGMDM
jgi:membrane fusion protein, copper/silver efflux system